MAKPTHIALGTGHSNFCLAGMMVEVDDPQVPKWKYTRNATLKVPTTPRVAIVAQKEVPDGDERVYRITMIGTEPPHLPGLIFEGEFCSECFLIYSYMTANGITSPRLARTILRKANR